MERHRNNVTTKVAIAIAISILAVDAADATPASGFTAAQQWKGVYGPLDVNAVKVDSWDVKIKSKDSSDVYVTRNSIDIGGQSGWHTHPEISQWGNPSVVMDRYFTASYRKEASG